MAISLLAKELEALRKISTPAVCNAIETFNVRPRNEGFMTSDIRCLFPDLGVMVGYAATARIVTDEPPVEGHQVSRLDWWDYLQEIPKPRVIVFQDLDRVVKGAYWDEQTANIQKALGCAGVVTDGGVRDLDTMHDLGLHAFAAHLLVSRAYVHLVDFGIPVRVGGLTVSPGDLLHGDNIFIRPARAGEKVVALNEESYQLDETNLVIADASGPIALAGIMGGLDSAINERTRRIVLESACFQASSVRKTSAKLRLRTEASMRFEKAQDPENTARALARIVELFHEVSPGIRLLGGLADLWKKAAPPAPIRLPLDWLTCKLGRAIEPGEVRDILERLSFGVSQVEPQVFSVTVPTWRATKDVSIKDDLVEEVGRMIGYDSIAPQPPLMPVTVPPSDPERLFERRLRAMVAAQGFTEVHNYSFLSEEQARELSFDPADHLAVKNPIAADQSLMRRSLVPGIFKNLRENSRHLDSFRLFEIGREVHPETRGTDGLPKEIPHLAASMFSREEGEANLFELKRVAECLMPGAEVRPAQARPFEHPARSAEVLWRDRAVGRLFALHPSLLAGRGAILDIDLDIVLELQPDEKRYRPIRRYPSSAFDLSVVAGARELVGDLQKLIAALAGEPLESIEFLRRYSGPPIPEGMQSVSFRLTVAAPDRTLSLEEAGAIRARIIDGMRERGYELRV